MAAIIGKILKGLLYAARFFFNLGYSISSATLQFRPLLEHERHGTTTVTSDCCTALFTTDSAGARPARMLNYIPGAHLLWRYMMHHDAQSKAVSQHLREVYCFLNHSAVRGCTCHVLAVPI